MCIRDSHCCGIAGADSSEFRSDVPAVIDLMPDQVDVEEKGGTMRLGLYPCNVYPLSLIHILQRMCVVAEIRSARPSSKFRLARCITCLLYTSGSSDSLTIMRVGHITGSEHTGNPVSYTHL